MQPVDHYRLDLDTKGFGESFCFTSKPAAMAAFRRHARRRDVLSAQLTSREADGEFIRNEAVCDNVRPDDDRVAQALGWPERY